MAKDTAHAMCLYSMTLSANEGAPLETDNDEEKTNKAGYWIGQQNAISTWCTDNCSKWAYQLEKGEGGHYHWQIQVDLNKKKRLKQLIGELKESKLAGAHISPTSRNGSRVAFNYAMKEDTRVMGPWTNMTEECPRELKEIKLRPFQEYIVADVKDEEPDPRKINVLIDPNGNIGKSILFKYIRYHKLGTGVPCLRDYKDVLQFICGAKEKKAFLIDIPRGTKKGRDFWAALETIKSGYAFDTRYKATEATFSNPKMWIFCNEVPQLSMMSEDRWRLWIVIDGKLKFWTRERHDEEVRKARSQPPKIEQDKYKEQE